jgi:hypothetical protein
MNHHTKFTRNYKNKRNYYLPSWLQKIRICNKIGEIWMVYHSMSTRNTKNKKLLPTSIIFLAISANLREILVSNTEITAVI